MGTKASSMLQDEEIKQIGQETGFSASQIEKLYSRFAHLDRSNCGALSKTDLLSIPELAINPLCDRLIQMFFSDCDQEDERINFRQFMAVLATFRSTENAKKIKGNKDSSLLKNYLPGASRTKDLPTRKSGPSMPSDNVSQTDKLPGLLRNDFRRTASEGRFNEGLELKLLFVFKVYDVDNDGRISFNDLRSILKMMVGNHIEDVQLDKIATRAFVEVDEDSDGFIEFSEFCKVFSAKDLDDKLRVKFFN